MFCPSCGQQQVIEETRFCSRCGFLLTGIAEVMANGGVLPQASASAGSNQPTPRKKGLKQGLFIFLLVFVVVPIMAILTAGDAPYAVSISAILLSVGGLLRMAYAMLFQSNEPYETMAEEKSLTAAPGLRGKKKNQNALPPQQSIPASDYAPPLGNWRETNDLAAPPSVTDSTTKLLQKDEH